MRITNPNRDTWRALFAAAARFYALKPWDWMDDSDIFGVRNPADGETGFCCIMGAGGEHFALALYLGSEGLEVLKKIGLQEVPTDPFTILSTQKCLMASFEDRELISADELGVIRDLGLKFRGRNAWPQFKSYLPGYAPWTVSQSEAEFLTLALEQASEVCPKYRERPDELGMQNAINSFDRFMIRVRTERDGKQVWEDTTETVPGYEPALILPAPPDVALLKAVAAKAKRSTIVLDMDFFLVPTGIREDKDVRPWYPLIVLCVDDKSGMILQFEMVPGKEIGGAFAQAFLDLVQKSGKLPARVRVRSEQALLLLEPALDELKVPIELADSLPMIEEAQQGLFNSI